MSKLFISTSCKDAIADWWFSKFANYDEGLFDENKRDRFRLGMALAFMTYYANHPMLTQLWLGTDFGPCQLLNIAMNKAKIASREAPWRTRMLVSKTGVCPYDGVWVMIGHTNKWEQIYEKIEE